MLKLKKNLNQNSGAEEINKWDEEYIREHSKECLFTLSFDLLIMVTTKQKSLEQICQI